MKGRQGRGFWKDVQTVFENTPVVGHGIAAGYAFSGDSKRAEDIAISATRSTAALAAGAACGPGAVACAIGAAAAGGVGFEVVREVVKNQPKNPPPHICKRSISDGGAHGFNSDLPPITSQILEGLPSSLMQVEIPGHEFISNTGFVNGILSLFFILKMIGKGHPSSKLYMDEICTTVYPSAELEHCYQYLKNGVRKYDSLSSEYYADSPEFDTEEGHLFMNSLYNRTSEMNAMMGKTGLGQSLVQEICMKMMPGDVISCQKELSQGADMVNKYWKKAENEKIILKRTKRCRNYY